MCVCAREKGSEQESKREKESEINIQKNENSGIRRGEKRECVCVHGSSNRQCIEVLSNLFSFIVF